MNYILKIFLGLSELCLYREDIFFSETDKRPNLENAGVCNASFLRNITKISFEFYGVYINFKRYLTINV